MGLKIVTLFKHENKTNYGTINVYPASAKLLCEAPGGPPHILTRAGTICTMNVYPASAKLLCEAPGGATTHPDES